MTTKELLFHPKRCAGNVVDDYYRQRAVLGKLPSLPFAMYRGMVQRFVHKQRWRMWDCDRWLTSSLPSGHPVRVCMQHGWNDGWALSPTTVMALWGLLAQAKPRVILEFGCGLSTALFASYCQGAHAGGVGGARLVSIEHEAAWIAQTGKLLAEHHLDGFVDFIHAPLSEQHLLKRRQIAYTLADTSFERVIPTHGIECVFIDGPPGSIGRIGCLPLIEPYLRQGACILLDDAYRPDEQEAWHTWVQHWPERLTSSRLILTSRGLAAGRWR